MLHFDTSLNDFDLHLKSQVYDKSKTSVPLRADFSISWDEIHFFATTCWFVEAKAKCTLHNSYSRERNLT